MTELSVYRHCETGLIVPNSYAHRYPWQVEKSDSRSASETDNVAERCINCRLEERNVKRR